MPPMYGRRPGFATLVHIILEQQVSIAAARTMFRRLGVHLGGVTPALRPWAVRACATSV
jgi:DNA-3-methyladenine glycosylase II